MVNAFDPWARDRGDYYSLEWKPRPGAEADEAFRIEGRQDHAGTSAARHRDPAPRAARHRALGGPRHLARVPPVPQHAARGERDGQAPAPGRHLDLHLASGARGLLRAVRRRRARVRAAPGGSDRGDAARRGGIAGGRCRRRAGADRSGGPPVQRRPERAGGAGRPGGRPEQRGAAGGHPLAWPKPSRSSRAGRWSSAWTGSSRSRTRGPSARDGLGLGELGPLHGVPALDPERRARAAAAGDCGRRGAYRGR